MISRHTYQGLTWVDLEKPTREEIIHILEEFSLPELIGEEMFASTLRSKVDLYDNFIYLILHFPTGQSDGNPAQEIDFIIGKKFILTVHYEKIDPMHDFAGIFESQSFITKDKTMSHAGFVFVEMLEQLYKTSLLELEDITTTISEIERRIFQGQEEAMVRKISSTSRKLLDFKQAIRFHKDVLTSYEIASTHFFGNDYKYYASMVNSEFSKVVSVLESHRDVLGELQRTNDSLLSSKSNDIMKTFTILTFVMLPLSIITGVFGMNTVAELIFIRSLGDFFFIIAAMLLIGFVMFIFFKFRKWL